MLYITKWWTVLDAKENFVTIIFLNLKMYIVGTKKIKKIQNGTNFEYVDAIYG